MENVRTFWNAEAAEWGDNPQVTIRDHYFRLLEIERVRSWVTGRRSALDIGCGSGFGTLFFAQEVGSVVGADLAPEMITVSRKLLTDEAHRHSVLSEFAPAESLGPLTNVRFEVGDITNLTFQDQEFDTVISERVLINLPTTSLQIKALDEVSRVLEPGGIFAVAEVSQEGHDQIDAIRKSFGLPPIEKYWHNLYVHERDFEEQAAAAGLNLSEKIMFETYQFLSKVVHPLLIQPGEPSFMSEFNQAAREVARAFPDSVSLGTAGRLEKLMNMFRTELETRQFEADTFEAVAERVVKEDPDISGCSHQVLYCFIRGA